MSAGGQGVFIPSRYKLYVAKVTQATTAAPAIGTEVVNELGAALVPARTSIGLYTFTLAGAFTNNKTLAKINGGTGAAMRVFNIEHTSADVLTVNVFDLGATPALADSGNFDLEIKVYY